MSAPRRLALVFAVAENGALGLRGGLPWSLPEDRAHFREKTLGHVVIMGRRTWEENGAPLGERTNVVVSRTFVPPPGVHAFATLDEALAFAWAHDEEPRVIGGARLFEEALPKATRIFLTVVPGAPEADTFFHLDRTGFRIASERVGEGGVRFVELERGP